MIHSCGIAASINGIIISITISFFEFSNFPKCIFNHPLKSMLIVSSFDTLDP